MESVFNSQEIISKIEEFEIKKELNKFFLIMFISGYIGIVSSFIEYFFHSVYNLDVTFYIFQDLGSNTDLSIASDPFLFIIVWSIHVLPLMAIFFYTSEKTGVIDFTRSYRKIAFVAVILFIIAELCVYFFAKGNYQFIPVIWGVIISIGLIYTGIVFYKDFNIKLISLTMFVCSFITIIEVLGVLLIVKENFIGPTVITFSIGFMLVLMSIFVYFLKKRNLVRVPLKSLKLFSDDPKEKDANIIRNLEVINNHLKNTMGITEVELFDYLKEARKIMIKSTGD